MKFSRLLALAALLPGLALARMPEMVQAELDSGSGITVTLALPDYELGRDEAGFDVIIAEGFGLSGEPGEALLPRRVYSVAVPPDTAFDSLSLQVIGGDLAKLPGTYDFKPAVQDMPSSGSVVHSVPPLHDTVSSSGVRASDFVRLLPPGQMRKWRFARLEFSPFQYDASSRELTVARRLVVEISYSADLTLSAQDTGLLADKVMDDVAGELLVNYDAAQAWYTSVSSHDQAGVANDYVIITTNAIEAASSTLATFVNHKQNRGHGVLVITEDEYGSLTGQAPNGTSEKIREWLKDNYVSQAIEYVLFIGDPDPDDPSNGSDSVGDIPMKMCWPRNNESTYKEAPTDYFYADLTGNWDADGDGYYGESGDDTVVGGVDYATEVYVGRIPVYGSDYATLDNILQKIIDYESEGAPVGWRQNALLPMSFSTTDYDGAPLAEQMMDDYLDSTGFSSWTQYQQGSGACALNSSYDSDEELHGSTVVRNRWSSADYGLVVWWGHGSETGTYIGASNCWDGTLFSNGDTTYLDDDHPAFVYQNSCMNGYPERSDNLQYALLKQGAIATVGATRVSWFNAGVGYGEFDGSSTNSGIGYEYAKRLAGLDQPAGSALYNAKAGLPPTWNTRLMNLYVFNLYGDPSTGLTSVIDGSTVSGYVRDPAGQGIQGAAVDFGGARPAVTTASDGYYYQNGFADGPVTLSLDLEGYTFSPFEDLVIISGADVIRDVTGYPENPGGPEFEDSFEGGSLGTDWAVETSYEGRVRIDSTYPYSGTGSLLLDDDTSNSTYSHAAVILPLNLTGTSEASLSFWWRGFGSEAHTEDGVFISDDRGQTWNKTYSFTGNSPDYTQGSIDLIEAASMSAMSVDGQFQIKFQFYGNESIQTDGYAIDEISMDAAVELHQVFLPVLIR